MSGFSGVPCGGWFKRLVLEVKTGLTELVQATGCFTMGEKDDTTCNDGCGSTCTSGMAASMSEDQFAQLLGAIKYVAEGNEIAAREEVRAVEKDAAEKIASIKKEKPVQFRKQSHEVQHSCNKGFGRAILRGRR